MEDEVSRYYTLNRYLKETFGCKVYKLALDGGMTCPNRDGTLGTRGCIFCGAGGSGEFAQAAEHRFTDGSPVWDQIDSAKSRVGKKMKEGKYIAYFQSYTNTYAPLPYLESLFSEAIALPEICALSIGTRPDCLPLETVALLSRLSETKPVWIELGLQTIHEKTAAFIRRGYGLPVFEDAHRRLKEAGLPVIVHVILGLPGESTEDMLDTIRYLADLRIDGIKLQLLHVLKGTDLDLLYRQHVFETMSLPDYLYLVGRCIRLLPPETVIHRLSGDGPKSLLTAPMWSANKRLVLNSLAKYLKENGIFQGQDFHR